MNDKLPVGGTLRDACTLVNQRWWSFAQALLVPAVLLCLLLLPNLLLRYIGAYGYFEMDRMDASAMSGWWAMAANLPALPIYVLIAVSCHRIALIGPYSLPNRWGIYWGRRETRFLGWFCLVGLIILLPNASVFSAFFWLAAEIGDGPNTLFIPGIYGLPFAGINVVTASIIAAIGLVLPATAIGDATSIKVAWRLSRGNYLRLFAVLVIPALLFTGLRHGSRFLLEFSLLGFGWLARQFMYVFLGAFEIIVLSTAYRHLSGTIGAQLKR